MDPTGQTELSPETIQRLNDAVTEPTHEFFFKDRDPTEYIDEKISNMEAILDQW